MTLQALARTQDRCFSPVAESARSAAASRAAIPDLDRSCRVVLRLDLAPFRLCGEHATNAVLSWHCHYMVTLAVVFKHLSNNIVILSMWVNRLPWVSRLKRIRVG